MSDSQWYVLGGDNRQAGPYTEQQVMDYLSGGTVTPASKLWRQGAADWLPLAQVEPFAGRLRAQAAAKRAKVLKLVLPLAGGALLIGLAVLLYFLLREPPEISEARDLVAAGSYARATLRVAPYQRKNPSDMRAVQVLAVARINEYATGDQVGLDALNDLFSGEGGFFGGLGNLTLFRDPCQHAAELFRKLLAADPGKAGLVRDELNAAMGRVPATDRSGVSRIEAIARVQVGLKLADAGQTADRFVEMADRAADPQRAGQLVDAAERLVPADVQRMDGYRLKQAEKLLAGGNAVGAAAAYAALQRLKSTDPAARARAAGCFVRVANALKATDRRMASDALKRAIALDASLADVEENAFLSLELTDQPGPEKFDAVRRILARFPDNPRCWTLRSAMMQDAVRYYDANTWSTDRARPCLMEAAQAAEPLIQKRPDEPGLTAAVTELGNRLVKYPEAAQKLAAVRLGKRLLDALPAGGVARAGFEPTWQEWRRQASSGLDERIQVIRNTEADDPGRALQQYQDLKKENVDPLLLPAGLDIDKEIRRLEARIDILNAQRARAKARLAEAAALEAGDPKRAVEEYGKIQREFPDAAAFPAGTDIPARIAALQTQIDNRTSVRDELARIDRLKRSDVVADLVKAYDALADLQRRFPDEATYPAGVRAADEIRTLDGRIRDLVKARIDAAKALAAGGSRSDIKKAVAQYKAIGSECDARFLPAGTDLAAEVKRLSESLELTVATTAAQLADALAEKDELLILWVRLRLADVDRDTRQKIKDWVDAGGALWLDSDLARDFDFGRMPVVDADKLRGTAKVAKIDHEVARGLTMGQDVGYTLATGAVSIEGTAANMKDYRVTPLLGWNDPDRRKGYVLICALHPGGRGVIVFRPAEIDTATDAGKTLADNLRSYSLTIAKSRNP